MKASSRVAIDSPAAGLERGFKEVEHRMANASAVRPGAAYQSISAIERYIPQLMMLGCKHRASCKGGDALTRLHSHHGGADGSPCHIWTMSSLG